VEPAVGPLAALDEGQVVADVVEQAAFSGQRLGADGDDQRASVVIQAVSELGIRSLQPGVLVDAGVVGETIEMVELGRAD